MRNFCSTIFLSISERITTLFMSSSFRNNDPKHILIIAVTSCIYILVFGVMIDLPISLKGYAQPTIENNSTLSVSGTATTKIKPDTATVSFGVETANATASSALMTNSEVMNKVLDVLKAAGAQENETSTSSFIITPN